MTKVNVSKVLSTLSEAEFRSFIQSIYNKAFGDCYDGNDLGQDDLFNFAMSRLPIEFTFGPFTFEGDEEN